MIIIGAGMAGLIAANYFRKRNPTVIEKQEKLPDNHAALLRFRSDKVFKVCGLQSKVVKVRKCVVFGPDFMSGPNPYLANMYSEKVTGRVEDRSIWNLATEERHIAPDGFIEKLASGCNIEFNKTFIAHNNTSVPTISTIPMPMLMKMLGWEDIPKFDFRPIWTITAELPWVNVNQTIYFPDMGVPYYRASLVGPRLIIELVAEPTYDDGIAHNILKEVSDYFGLNVNEKATVIEIKKQPLGKMLPIDNELRKNFMHWATEKFSIYSLGRFATWRPLLLDDVVDDLAVIERMMSSKYNTMLLK